MIDNSNRLHQLFYAKELVDSIDNYYKYEIIEAVLNERNKELEEIVENQINMLNIKSIEDLYSFINDIYGFSNWEVDNFDKNHIEARSSNCLLSEIAKKKNYHKPCTLFCINFINIFSKKLGFELEVKNTLWYNIECCFIHHRIKRM